MNEAVTLLLKNMRGGNSKSNYESDKTRASQDPLTDGRSFELDERGGWLCSGKWTTARKGRITH